MADRAMSEEDLISICRKEEQSGKGFWDSTLSALYEKSLNYYDRQPYGDEQEGSSSVVTSEFQDVIESLMPGLMDVFCGTDNPVQFTARRPGEEKWEDEATDYVPHVLMDENNGFVIVSALLKDALMYRLSGATVDLEDDQETRKIPVKGLPQAVIDELVAKAKEEPGAELEMELVSDASEKQSHEAVAYSRSTGVDRCAGCVNFTGQGCTLVADPIEPDGWCQLFGARAPEAPLAVEPPATFSGSIAITRKFKRVVVENIAPEDIRFTPTARDQDKASFQGFIKRVTSSDLVQMLLDDGRSEGEAQAFVDDLRSERPISPEDSQRNASAAINEQERSTVGDSERPLWVVVAYVKADVNGDGISEMSRVVYAHSGGAGGRLIDWMEWKEEAAITLGTPILMPHTIAGRCIFDQVEELQLVSSVLMRGFLDNQYMVTRPRPVVSDKVNLDSLLDWTPGSPVRLKAQANPGEEHVRWLQVPDIGGTVLGAMEYLSTVRENRTGVVRNTQGIEGQTLQNKTLGGLDRMLGAASRRQDLIAQTFAQTAIKRLYLLIYRAVKRAATGPISYRVGNGAWANVDPTQWPDDMTVSVDTGTGTGGREAAVSKLGVVAQLQEKLITLQGDRADGPYVLPENIANTAQAMADKLGYKTPGRFFQPPAKVTEQIANRPKQEPQVPPEMLAAQAQIAIMQQAAQADIEIKREKAAADAETARLKAQSDIAIAEYKAMQWAQIEREKAGLKAHLDDREMARKAGLKGLEIAADAHVAASQPPAQPNGNMPQ